MRAPSPSCAAPSLGTCMMERRLVSAEMASATPAYRRFQSAPAQGARREANERHDVKEQEGQDRARDDDSHLYPDSESCTPRLSATHPWSAR